LRFQISQQIHQLFNSIDHGNLGTVQSPIEDMSECQQVPPDGIIIIIIILEPDGIIKYSWPSQSQNLNKIKLSTGQLT